MAALPDVNTWDRMLQDYRLMALSPSAHPMSHLRDLLPADVLTHTQLKESHLASEQLRPG